MLARSLHFLREWTIPVLLVAFVQLLEYHGLLGSLESFMIDTVVQFSAPVEKPAPILVVDIDEDSYKSCFGGKSPLSRSRLADAVRALARTNKQPGPAVMGIDILTDSDEDRDADPASSYDPLKQIPFDKNVLTRIVWAAAPLNPSTEVPSYWKWLAGSEDELRVDGSKVLGIDTKQLPDQITGESDLLWGMPLYARDEDSRVRHFPREVHVDVNADGQNPERKDDKIEWPLPRKIAAVRREVLAGPDIFPGGPEIKPPAVDVSWQDGKPLGEDVKEVLVSKKLTLLRNSYVARPPRWSYKLNELVDCKTEGFPGLPALSDYQSLTRNRLVVVLLGGTYALGRDDYRTSNGTAPGLYLNANALAVEMEGQPRFGTRGIGVREANRPFLLLGDLLLARAIMWAFSTANSISKRRAGRLRRLLRLNTLRLKMALSLLSLSVVFLLSGFAIWWGYLWVSCIGIAFGFLLHLPVEIYRDAGHGRHKREHTSGGAGTPRPADGSA